MDEQPYMLPNGIATTRSGYSHLADYKLLTQSAKACPMCGMIERELKGAKVKPGKKHTLILMTDKHQSDPNAPYAIAAIIALVENSDLRAYFRVFARPGRSNTGPSEALARTGR
jgi:hypothetical protein